METEHSQGQPIIDLQGENVTHSLQPSSPVHVSAESMDLFNELSSFTPHVQFTDAESQTDSVSLLPSQPNEITSQVLLSLSTFMENMKTLFSGNVTIASAFGCDFCGLEFTERSNRDRHRRRCHGRVNH
jgi:hypothetical protein